ncbi:DNA topoisomerase 3 [Legionella fairfieldensis]|uniref:DNA topoisomerase 3 n=1 Tax=Legionella fairfieldensis TaxID=45064 RepID=UPI00048B82DA|nr:DNA topoisomerase 3 [Legionella fairfieldensis]
MRLFIAEKPSVAKAIAEELGITSKGEGYIESHSDKITWCFGHMLEQAEPDFYTDENIPRNPNNGKKRWRVEDLPIIPQNWIVHPKKDSEKQLQLIGQLLKEAELIVNAGDSDREGQLLIDEVLEYFNCKKPVLRFWVSAHDSISLQRGLSAMKDNSHYKGLGYAAKGRARADWLIGMNLSRAYTLRAQRGGSRTLLTVGRVQTPTLALVVARDRNIEAFKSIPYHTIKAAFQHGDNAFIAHWRANENQAGLDEEGRLIDTTLANSLITKVSGQSGLVTHYNEEIKKKAHPHAYSLSDITLLASNKFGYSALEVLETCQSLYETHKLTSYPRTDCAFLPESQHADAPLVLAAIKEVNPDLSAMIDAATPSIKSKTWDDTKVSVHYGIIPTTHRGSIAKLNDKERNIYDLIVRAYIAQFYPLHEYLSTTVKLVIEGETFEASGQSIHCEGWCAIYKESRDEQEKGGEDNQKIPSMLVNDNIQCIKASRQDVKTKPPSRFTEGTLQRAMENIHKFITEPEHKKMLRDGDGIGTSATRASIISELKRRHFIEAKGKQIISTSLGRSMIDALPEVVKSPVLTAIYERLLRDIEKEPSYLDGFIEKQIKFVTEQVVKANDGAVKINGAEQIVPISELYKCHHCKKGLARRKGQKGFWWSCSGYPECSQTYKDFKGKPVYNNN